MRITVRVEGHYEVRETPFARTYEWQPAYIVLECNCGEKWTLTGQSTMTTCRCGADYSAIVNDIQEREGRLGRESTHPWRYDVQGQEEQRLRDEAAYPENSPWRYNDVTSRGADDERNAQ